MRGRFTRTASRVAEAASYIHPEILAIPPAKMDEFLQDPALRAVQAPPDAIAPFPAAHPERQGREAAGDAERAGRRATRIFRQLNDTDIKFGTVDGGKGQQIELSHATFIALLNSSDRDVRAGAFHAYYRQYTAHAHTLAETLNTSIQSDMYYAKARNHPSSLAAALFPDHVPVAVYDNLIASIHRQLPALHEYYQVRRRKMGLEDIHHYDTYVPILSETRMHHTWDEAVKVILAALEPLGSEYGSVLRRGLTRDRWCDRYENRGKQSGAFSAGSFDGNPYILINYQPDVLEHVFTLAHEGGHSMHSHFSCKTQPYAYHEYSLFVAEVASTFNEAMLGQYLLQHARDKQQRAMLINRQIDAIRSTIFRQTMFAEFEKLAHDSAEAGEPLTLERLKEIYHGLLQLYFGPEFALDAELDLECLRVPHFYRTFYVYKYATGMSAALALVDRVTSGGQRELDDYLGFLKGGCSKDPLDLLRGAGVDMEKPDRVDTPWPDSAAWSRSWTS